MSKNPKSNLDYFQSQWNELTPWAKSVGVSTPDIETVAQMDWQRVLSGSSYLMSKDEAESAMLSLQKGQAITSVPQDNPPSVFSDPFGAVRNDVQGLVSGLMPNHLVPALWDQVKEAVEHPSSLYAWTEHPAGESRSQQLAYQGAQLAKTPLLDLVPFVSDVGNLMSAHGRAYLSQHPISALLDVGGVGKIADIAEQAAKVAGFDSAADLAARFPDHPISNALKAGWAKFGAGTSFDDYVHRFLGSFGLLADQRERILRPLAAGRQALSSGGQELLQTLNGIVKSLTPQEYDWLNDLTSYGRDPDTGTTYDLTDPTVQQELLSDENLPETVRHALQVYFEYQDKLKADYLGHPDQGGAYNRSVTGQGTEAYGAMFEHNGDTESVPLNSPIWRYKREHDQAVLARHTAFTGAVQTAADNAQALAKLSGSHDVPSGAFRTGETAAQDTYAGISQRFRQGLLKTYDEHFGGPKDTAAQRAAYGAWRRRWQQAFDDRGPMRDLEKQLARKTIDTGAVISAIYALRRTLNSSMLLKGADGTLTTELTQLASFLDQLEADVKTTRGFRGKWAAAKDAVRDSDRAVRKAEFKLDKRWLTDSAPRYSVVYHDLTWDKLSEKAMEKTAAGIESTKAALEDKLDKVMTRSDESDALWKSREGDRNRLASQINRKLAALPNIHVVSDEEAGNLVDAIARKDPTDPDAVDFVTKELPRIKAEVLAEIATMRSLGQKPLFVPRVHPVDIGSIEHPGLTADKTYTPQSSYQKTFGLGSSVHDTLVGLTLGQVQILRRDIQRGLMPFFESKTLTLKQLGDEAVNDYISHHGRPPSDVQRTIEEYKSARGFQRWDPDSFSTPVRKSSFSAAADERYMRNYDVNLLHKTFTTLDKSLTGAWNKAMGLFRFSILGLSPRYVAHIILGGTFFLLAESGPSVLRYFKPALDMVRSGDFPEPMSIGVNEADAEDRINSPEARFNEASGKTGGRLLIQGVIARTGLPWLVAKHEAYMGMLEHVSNFQRALAYFQGAGYAARKGVSKLLTDDELEDARLWGLAPHEYYGVKVANRVLADLKAHTPLERQITRTLVPFYGWTRHVIRFVVKFPFDHPLRAAVMSNLANVALDEDQGLPEYYFRLMFLGAPNQLGDVTVVDTRQWNPIRDVANYMTMQGVIQALNPLLQAGINDATGGTTGELYPTLDYNSFYGSEGVAGGSNIGAQVAAQFIPQLGAVENLMNSTSQLRYDEKYDPSKFRYDLYDQLLNVPWVPYQLNVKQMLARQEIDQYDQAGAAAQMALENNTTQGLQGYGPLLPLSGWNVTPGYLQSLISGDTSGYPEASVLAMRYAPRVGYAELNNQGNESVVG